MNLSANTWRQRTRLLDYLREHQRVTTLEARTELDIMHPAARIQELREAGNNIITYRRVVNTGVSNHKIAEYVLVSS